MAKKSKTADGKTLAAVDRGAGASRSGGDVALGVERLSLFADLVRSAKKVPVKVSPVVSAVTKAFSKGALRAISVRFSKGKLSFAGIDPAALPALVSALSGLKLPVS